MLHHVLAALIDDIEQALLETRALLDEALSRNGYASPESAAMAADAVHLSLQLRVFQVNAATLLQMAREPNTALASEFTRIEWAEEAADRIAARACQPPFAELSARTVRLGTRLKHLSMAMNR